MNSMPLSQIAKLIGGRVIGDGDVIIEGVSTDTRKLPDADGRALLFVALRGENFDGHAHVTAAAERGAAAALVAHEVDASIPQIVVADTELALGALARGLQRERGTKVFAVTGSNGKTSVKTLLLSILEQAGGAYANPGNFNNEIGLPLSAIAAPEDARFAVYEMGAGKLGDIKYLTEIVRPDIALVNNIAPAHLERMGSLLNVADTKAAIYDALPADGVAVINADDAFAPYFAERAHGRSILRFGLEASADVFASDINLDKVGSRFHMSTPAGDVDVALALPGRHNISNALAAATMSLAAGIDIDTIRVGLQASMPVSGRGVARRLRSGAELIDDSYNANPGSTHAAIDTLASGGGEAWLVLGDMRELGADEIELHAEVGRRAKAAGIARLFTLGVLSAHASDAFGDGAMGFDSHEALAEALKKNMHEGVRVLVKGSRGSAMDRVVAALLQGEDTNAA
ncbi:UDP-N-acetylmuramoyl-tripeptide--D-alanyl-D-alanine ligase [Solilutibacter tolerans]|uniref:UDP-N-acetylmuramoyl-tripeptide--D-alanyl-D-alanine ligase n=1 Tax=Solilutibacter tolerans TaxID=1604334 RepID=A0A1N6NCJ6_9GAMM|nr:UDP-N-acetylmuramoyl-tripeptide--D-alanyl-D-alanine ligase [Lysobacter tolerans]SIP89785.1 UDP-N-acetylmuramoyl-tripeptide--D-alanyl-D-alanine ligase [Lysobacter tolerans]